MKWFRQLPQWAKVALGLLVLLWATALGGVVGWAVGYSMASRQGQNEMATAVARALQLPDLGVVVTRLDQTGPAAQSGVERGDLIVALNGEDVQDARELRERLRSFSPSDEVLLRIRRSSGEVSLPVRLAPFPGETDRSYIGIYYTARPEEPGDL